MQGHLEGLSYNRVVEGGPIDPELFLIRVDRTDGTPLVVIANFSCHCVTRKHTNTKISRDYPGVASEIIERTFPGSTMMFLQLLLANPGEIFVTFALRVKEKSPLRKTAVLGYSNDFVGYIPDRDDFQRKGYAADLVPRICDSFQFRPDVGDVLVREATKIANEII